MEIVNRNKKIASLAIGLSVIALLTACGGSGGGNADSSQPAFDPTTQEASGGLLPIVEQNGTSEFTPNLGSNIDAIQEDFTEGGNNEFIAAEWVRMQECMQVSAMEPEFTVVAGTITPIDSNDDVVRHIDGMIQASSHVTDTSAAIQIREADFDGSLGDPGSYLRSIIGRYLWFANGFAERDYPFECARN